MKRVSPDVICTKINNNAILTGPDKDNGVRKMLWNVRRGFSFPCVTYWPIQLIAVCYYWQIVDYLANGTEHHLNRSLTMEEQNDNQTSGRKKRLKTTAGVVRH